MLVTRRLVLRRPVAADIASILAVHRDRQACAHNPADMLDSHAAAATRFRQWDEHWQRHGFGYRVVTEAGATLGFCGVKLTTLAGRDVLNLLYRLTPSTWGRGIATEAATAVVTEAAALRPARPVIARIRPANRASAAVATRAGLHRTPHLDTPGEDGEDHLYTSHW